jgi:signal peptidase I
MTDRPGDWRPAGDELDIQLTPVDDEFEGAATTLTAPRPAPLPAPQPPPEVRPRRPRIPPLEPLVREPAPRSSPRIYFEALVATLVVWLFAATFLVQPVEVPTGSMLDTILIGDHVLVNRMVYGTPLWLAPPLPYRAIRRGDVVVFRHPTDPENLYVKRIVGLPGETVEIYGTRVYVDGRELPERRALVSDPTAGMLEVVETAEPGPGATYTVYYSRLRDLGDGGGLDTLASVDRATFGVGRPFTIPEGEYFCLGDNRDNSLDSRFWGTVPRELVVGRAVAVYWSDDASAPRLLERIRWARIGTLIQ